MQSYLYGFEDYKLMWFYGNFVDNNYHYIRLYGDNNSHVYIPAEGLPVHNSNYDTVIDDGIIEDHKELIDTAKTVYVHKNCSISRALVSTKFKKTLNPWTADIVVIPKTNKLQRCISKDVFFINESTKTIFGKTLTNYVDGKIFGDTDIRLWNSTEKQRFGDMCPPDTEFDNYTRIPGITKEDLLDSTLLYKGIICNLESKEGFILDIFTNSIPKSKIVFEGTLQSALGSEDNKVTLETLLSIYDMLESKDSDILNTGLKSLAMMDYVHYPNSVIYMLNQTNGSYRWCNASNSTSVKFMMQNLHNNKGYRRSSRLNEKTEVSEEDYELYKQLVEHFEKDDTKTLMDKLKWVNFMAINSEGILTPRLKETA